MNAPQTPDRKIRRRKPVKAFLLEHVAFRLGDLLLGTDMIRRLKTHRIYNRMNEEELETVQRKKMIALLQHATSTCPGYSSCGPAMDDPYAWIKRFPILTKSEIIRNGDAYLSDQFEKNRLIRYESSGSTGQRSVVYIDKKEQSNFRAILINWWEWNGYYLGKPMVQTGMTTDRGIVKKIKDILLSTIYVNAFYLTEEDILPTLRRIEHKKNMNFFGYASSLYVIGQVALKYGFKIRFDLVMSQGDKLFDHYKKTLEEAFGCAVVEDYGLNEGIMVGQKSDLPYFYIYTPSTYLELVDNDGKPVPDGEIGRVIATKLDGFAMPLIRYDTGDLAIRLPRHRYPPQRMLAFPLLEKVIGRNTDIIKTPEGNTFIVHTFTGIFEFFPEILQFQVVQDEADYITVNYIPSASFSKDVLPKIEARITEKTKSRMMIRWNEVADIPRSSSGKPQIIINNLVKRSLTTIQ